MSRTGDGTDEQVRWHPYPPPPLHISCIHTLFMSHFEASPSDSGNRRKLDVQWALRTKSVEDLDSGRGPGNEEERLRHEMCLAGRGSGAAQGIRDDLDAGHGLT